MDQFWTDALTLLRVVGLRRVLGRPDTAPAAVGRPVDKVVVGRCGGPTKRPAASASPAALAPALPPLLDGDHSDGEETRIVIREHLRRIWGAILLAAVLSTVLSWAMWPAKPPSPFPSSSPSPSLPTSIKTNTPTVDFVQEGSRLPDPWLDGFIPADTKKVGVVFDDQIIAGYDVDPTETETETDYVPPRHYRRPPSAYLLGSDPRIRLPGDFSPEKVRDVVVHSPRRPQANSNLPPIGASGFAAARKAARAAQNAAADKWVLALRQRLHEGNRNGGAVGLHRDDDELALARAAFGLGCSACGGNNNNGIDMDALLSYAIQQRRQRSGDGFRDDSRFSINNPHDSPSE